TSSWARAERLVVITSSDIPGGIRTAGRGGCERVRAAQPAAARLVPSSPGSQPVGPPGRGGTTHPPVRGGRRFRKGFVTCGVGFKVSTYHCRIVGARPIGRVRSVPIPVPNPPRSMRRAAFTTRPLAILLAAAGLAVAATTAQAPAPAQGRAATQ